MGFVGGGGNIAITTALPPSSFVYCCKYQIVYGFSLSHFYGCLRLRFLDVETNPGPHCPAPAVCRILWSNVRGLAGNLSDLTVASSQYDMLLCSLRLWSQICVSSVTCRRCWFPVSVCLSCVGARCLGPWDGCICSRWLRSISPTQI